MYRTKTLMLLLSLCLLIAVTVMAQSAQKAGSAKGKAGKGILHPQMTPQSGTYEKPAASVGTQPAQPWSATTFEASVDGKPLDGKVVKVVGEVIDYSCYLQVGKHGDKHRDCAQKCFRNGQPIGLLTKDGSLYLLMEEEHHPRRDGDTNLREKAIEHASNVVEVTGTHTTVDNVKALYVQGLTKR